MRIMTFTGIVTNWVDGDTVDVTLDLGFKVFIKQRFRLARINTPEKGTAQFYSATAKAKELAPIDSTVSVTCFGYDKYQRWIADLYTGTTCINTELLTLGYAVPYKG